MKRASCLAFRDKDILMNACFLHTCSFLCIMQTLEATDKIGKPADSSTLHHQV